LVRSREILKVQVCNLFGDAFRLPNAPYAVLAPASVDDFRQFVLTLEEKDVEVTKVDISGLFLLCDEFGFWTV
jgi:phage terminase small subunit